MEHEGYDLEVDVAVIGAGLGGLAVCLALQNRGIAAHVFEAAPQIRNISQGVLGLGDHALRALSAIHGPIVEELERVGKRHKSAAFVARNEGSTTISTGQADSLFIRWHRLQEILYRHTNSKFVHTSCKSVSVKEDADFACAEFNKSRVEDPSFLSSVSASTTKVKANLIIGSDGTFSAVRKFVPKDLFPDEPEYFGQMNWAALVQRSDLPFDPFERAFDGHDTGALVGDESFVIFTTTHPASSTFILDCGEDWIAWQVRLTDEQRNASASGPSGRGGLGIPGVKHNILNAMRKHREVYDLVEATPETRIVEGSIHHRLPLGRYSSTQRRIVLMGDAAHAMHPRPGQGAAMTFEDALVLAECLRLWRHDIPRAVQSYEELRIPRANAVQAYAARMGARQKSPSADPALRDRSVQEMKETNRFLKAFDVACVQKLASSLIS